MSVAETADADMAEAETDADAGDKGDCGWPFCRTDAEGLETEREGGDIGSSRVRYRGAGRAGLVGEGGVAGGVPFPSMSRRIPAQS